MKRWKIYFYLEDLLFGEEISLRQAEQLVWRDPDTGEALLRNPLKLGGGLGLPIGVGFDGKAYSVTNARELIEHNLVRRHLGADHDHCKAGK